jgi:hypothetical protein
VELAASVEKAAAGSVAKAVVGRSGGEDKPEARWRDRRNGEEGERERAVEKEAWW